MRIAIITESFPSDVDGVAHCTARVAENLVRKGHSPWSALTGELLGRYEAVAAADAPARLAA